MGRDSKSYMSRLQSNDATDFKWTWNSCLLQMPPFLQTAEFISLHHSEQCRQFHNHQKHCSKWKSLWKKLVTCDGPLQLAFRSAKAALKGASEIRSGYTECGCSLCRKGRRMGKKQQGKKKRSHSDFPLNYKLSLILSWLIWDQKSGSSGKQSSSPLSVDVKQVAMVLSHSLSRKSICSTHSLELSCETSLMNLQKES